ncbi:MAG: DUF882 domain-containing protein [Candidatus Binataceae bacterium]
MKDVQKGGQVDEHESISRRRFIKSAVSAGIVGAAPMLIPASAWARMHVRRRTPHHADQSARSLSFNNLHTGERLHAVYWEHGKYLPGGLEQINYILRDYRRNEVKPIDPKLLDLLVALRMRLQTSASYEVISGYRSPITNAMLFNTTEGVSLHSMHVQGKAIDLHVPGRNLRTVRLAALSLHRGGVGYYPNSNFVHVDTGRVRWWMG